MPSADVVINAVLLHTAVDILARIHQRKWLVVAFLERDQPQLSLSLSKHILGCCEAHRSF